MTNAQKNIKTPFNEEFCTQLEYRICDELEKSINQKLKGYWCDGISWLPTNDNQLTKKYVNDNRKIETNSWIGKDGQTEYSATIHFGPKALSRYARSLDLKQTIPDLESQNDWIEIDVDNKIIEIKLD